MQTFNVGKMFFYFFFLKLILKRVYSSHLHLNRRKVVRTLWKCLSQLISTYKFWSCKLLTLLGSFDSGSKFLR